MTRRPLGHLGGLALLAWIAVAQGCSSTSALDVGYPDARSNASLLAAAPPRRVDVAGVADRRSDTLDGPVADVPGNEDARQAGLEQHRRPVERPQR